MRFIRIYAVIVGVAFYDVVLAVHIMAVVFAFGATLAYPVLLGTIGKADSRALPALYKALHAISTRVIMPGLALVVICGIYMASDHKLWSEFFVQWGLGAVIAIGAVEGMFLSPHEKKLVEVADRDLAASGNGPFQPSTEHDTLVKRIGAVGAMMDLLVLLTILFMAIKP
ncbi:MAG TPA: hypothetical protein VIG42_04665 [Solirubrobacteraceae bacterium]|jgi:hypothetical protein